ncbi:hypothetical protein PoB_000286200 [Plakobranchus ocellatus]|uniref:Uncharacterized protein n=1 Tax=Plakobranchus ocellatus TaxID=259542 RepID=A0AAV3Y2P9_9GAST|nr:hypothetical protein PoB_000286200 [Plakobranchus ocellatus]
MCRRGKELSVNLDLHLSNLHESSWPAAICQIRLACANAFTNNGSELVPTYYENSPSTKVDRPHELARPILRRDDESAQPVSCHQRPLRANEDTSSA